MADISYPKTLAACVDLLKTKRTERLAADKVAEELKKQEDALELHTLKMDKDTTAIAGELARAERSVVETAVIEGWGKFIVRVT